MRVVLIAGAMVLLVIAAGVGVYFLGYHSGGTASQPDTTSLVITELPVTDLPTVNGVETPSPNPMIIKPQTMTIAVPASLKDQLAGYRLAGLLVVGPPGWTGGGTVGANGNTAVGISPAVPDGRAISINLPSPMTLNPVFAAGPYNSWVRDHWDELGIADLEPVPTPVPGIEQVTPHVVRYSFSAGNGLVTFGEAFCDLQDYNGVGEFVRIEATLPPRDAQLAAFILDQFISTHAE